MTNCYIPTCYFPSTVIFIDDSRDFLLNFCLQLDDTLSYRLYDSPYEALKALKVAQAPTQLHKHCVTEQAETEGCPLTNQSYNVDLAAIHWEVYNPQRFNEISVVVVDYDMPGINGLELCEKLADSPVKKILLTGLADEKIAIKAFNHGLIDCFVKKNDPNITELINESIIALQRDYFRGMSDLIVKMLSVKGVRCLQDPVFADFFEKLCRQHNITEYYLTENTGSFLLLDINAKPSCLIVKNREDLNHYCELAIDNQASPEVIEQLRSGEAIPYFWQADGALQNEWSDWSSYLHPAQRLEGHDTYFYAFVDNPHSFDIQADKIMSYNDYLSLQDEVGAQDQTSI